MTDRKSPLDQALELFVYAPLGLAITARDNLPALVEKGRQQVNNQLAVARMMGQYAVAEGEKQMRERVEQVSETVGTLLDQSRGGSESGPAATPPTAAADVREGSGTEPASASNGKAGGPRGASATGDHLAITGYDTLSASQVVQRLAGLSAEEREAVRAYEERTRGRRTILSKIGQLQAEPNS